MYLYRSVARFSTSSSSHFFARFMKPIMNAAPKEHIVEQLLKPVGLRSPPNPNTVYTEGNNLMDLFDGDKTEERIKELEIEFSKSGMYEMSTFKKTNGKMFISPASYWKSEKALYFPHLHGKPLSDTKGSEKNLEDQLKGKLSVVRVFSTQIGDNISQSYLQNDEVNVDHSDSNEKYQIINLHLLENKLKTWFFKLSLGKLRSTTKDHDRYWLCDRAQIPFLIREKLLINNVYTGFLFVVDRNLKIRYMASGAASPEEFKALWRVVDSLSRETRA
ncbi:Mitochondrial ATPase complex subunit ATP10 [Nakaseomyces bracarensis]|uniref:Mitochondrial ATPase complex subunit ATP10 n=1 Tax=Nakaseomyces bracarensis TaxID=273131 RepID=A0ABR4NSK0_9SACH